MKDCKYIVNSFLGYLFFFIIEKVRWTIFLFVTTLSLRCQCVSGSTNVLIILWNSKNLIP